MANMDFKRYFYTLDIDQQKKVESIEFNLVGADFTGDINVTDLQLQSGKQATAPIPNSQELLERAPFNINENDFLSTVNNPVKEGVQPKIYENINNRIFNIVGRGRESIALPNVVDEDYSQELVTSALDIVLKAKQDFDLLRISTSEGSLIPNRQYDGWEYPPLAEHPLNVRYTREFYFGGGKAGDEIKLTASDFIASINGDIKPLMRGKLNVNGNILNDIKQRFVLAPYGTFRVNIEFYKEVTETLYWSTEYGSQQKEATYFKDVGIGFYGYAEFNQTKGGARY